MRHHNVSLALIRHCFQALSRNYLRAGDYAKHTFFQGPALSVSLLKFQRNKEYCKRNLPNNYSFSYIFFISGMADVNCRRLQRLKHYVDLDYLSSNFYVWDGAVGRISNTYKYNSTVRGIVPNTDQSK